MLRNLFAFLIASFVLAVPAFADDEFLVDDSGKKWLVFREKGGKPHSSWSGKQPVKGKNVLDTDVVVPFVVVDGDGDANSYELTDGVVMHKPDVLPADPVDSTAQEIKMLVEKEADRLTGVQFMELVRIQSILDKTARDKAYEEIKKDLPR